MTTYTTTSTTEMRREQLVSSSKGLSFGSTVGYYKLSLIERVTKGFDRENEIGFGAFGRVFAARIGTLDVVCSLLFSSLLCSSLLYSLR